MMAMDWTKLAITARDQPFISHFLNICQDFNTAAVKHNHVKNKHSKCFYWV